METVDKFLAMVEGEGSEKEVTIARITFFSMVWKSFAETEMVEGWAKIARRCRYTEGKSEGNAVPPFQIFLRHNMAALENNTDTHFSPPEKKSN